MRGHGRFDTALEKIAAEFGEATGIPVRLTVEGDRKIDVLDVVGFYLLLQYRLADILRSGTASEVALSLSLDSRNIRLSISDDGSATDTADEENAGNLGRMKLLAQDMGVSLRIAGSENKGLRVVMDLETRDCEMKFDNAGNRQQQRVAEAGPSNSDSSGSRNDVVGEFNSDERIFDKIVDLEPDILLIESGWPTLEVQIVCGKIMDALPSVAIVMTTATGSEEELSAARKAGASVCVPGTVSASEFVQSIRTVLDSRLRLDRKRDTARLRDTRVNRSESGLDSLSERELEILSMVGAGFSNDEISRALNIATGTVRNDITRIRSKLDIHYRPRLVRFAVEQGLKYRHERP